MKKEIYLAIIFLILANGIQADMLVSAKDSTTVDSTEVVTLQFSDAEIMRIIEDSKSLNPHIEDMNIVQPGETVNYLIHDSIYSVKIPQGSSCWKVLSKGIKKIEIKPIKASSESLFESSFFDSENKKIILDSIFLNRVDSILENRNDFREDSSDPDSSLTSKKTTAVDSGVQRKEFARVNSVKKKPLVLPKKKIKNVPTKKSAVSIKDSLIMESIKEVDSMKVKDSLSRQDTNYTKSKKIGGFDYPGPRKKMGSNNFLLIAVMVGLVLLVILILTLSYFYQNRNKINRKRKNRRVKVKATEYYSDERNPNWDKRDIEDP